MIKIPLYKQKNMHYCAPAVAQMVLAAHGIRISQDALAKEMKTPDTPHEGTRPEQLVALFKKHGFKVRAGENHTMLHLEQALKNDEIPVICYTEPLEEWGHYAIVKGFFDDLIILIDSDSRTGTTSLLKAEFRRRWRDPLFTKTVRWAAFVSLNEKPRSKRRSSR